MEPARVSITGPRIDLSFPNVDSDVTIGDRRESTSSSHGSSMAREIRRINPPNLGAAYLGERILCHRPLRHGSPNFSVQHHDYGHVVANNYGHGGSGWTLGPGSAQYVVASLEQSCPDLTKDCPIAIIGAGASGLFTAYFLVQQGYRNVTIMAETFDNLTSHNAGGLLAPMSMDNDSEMQRTIDQMGVAAYTFYREIAEKKHPDFVEGVRIVPAYFQNRKISGLEPYVAAKVMQVAKKVLLDFGNGTTRKMMAYEGIFIDTAKIMVALTDCLKGRVSFMQRRVDDMGEIEQTYVINCTGLGAKDLNCDKHMESVQGHLIMLKAQHAEDLQYMVITNSDADNGIARSGHRIERSFYLFPKKLPGSGLDDVGVLGGTFVYGATKDTPNEEEFDRILDRAKRFYGITSAEDEECELLDGARRYYGPHPFGTPTSVHAEEKVSATSRYEEPADLFCDG